MADITNEQVVQQISSKIDQLNIQTLSAKVDSLNKAIVDKISAIKGEILKEVSTVVTDAAEIKETVLDSNNNLKQVDVLITELIDDVTLIKNHSFTREDKQDLLDAIQHTSASVTDKVQESVEACENIISIMLKNYDTKVESLMANIVDYKKTMDDYLTKLMAESDKYLETKYQATELMRNASSILSDMSSILAGVDTQTNLLREVSETTLTSLKHLADTVAKVTDALATPSKALVISETAENVVNVLTNLFPRKVDKI